jgi:hypothetical protein
MKNNIEDADRKFLPNPNLNEISGRGILNFQNTFDRPCDEIRMEIQTENVFRSLISMRLT